MTTKPDAGDDPPRCSIRDLADGAAEEPSLDGRGRVRRPLLVVELDAEVDPATLERAVTRAAAADRLLIGVTTRPPSARVMRLARALDLTVAGPGAGAGRECVGVLDPDEHLAILHRAAVRNPIATAVLGQVLRMNESLPAGAALDAESFAYSTLLGGPEFQRWLMARGPRPLPPEAASPVRVDRAGGELLITLNRPKRRNAYGRQVRDALVEALRVALLDPGVVRVVLDGAGPSFCSGGDLDEFGTAPDPATAHLVRTRGGAGALIHRLGHRIEVRVHGSCVGAGTELPAFAGTVVAAPGTTFRLPEIGMGLIPGAGGTVGIPCRIGRRRTLDLALTGRSLDTPTALAWGLVDRIDAR